MKMMGIWMPCQIGEALVLFFPFFSSFILLSLLLFLYEWMALYQVMIPVSWRLFDILMNLSFHSLFQAKIQ